MKKKLRGPKTSKKSHRLPSLAFLVVVLRIAVAIAIFVYPLEAILISIVLDIIDSWFIAFAGVPKSQYHNIDKPIDFVTHLIELTVSLFTPYFWFFGILFVYRALGQTIFNKYRDSRIFVIFPNFFEYFFLAYLIIARFDLQIELFDWRIVVGIVVLKVLNEIYLHMFPFDTAYKVRSLFFKEKLSLEE